MDTWNGDNYPITRFLSETGVQSMASIRTWLRITNSSEDLYFNSDLMINRQHHYNGQYQMMFVHFIRLICSLKYFVEENQELISQCLKRMILFVL